MLQTGIEKIIQEHMISVGLPNVETCKECSIKIVDFLLSSESCKTERPEGWPGQILDSAKQLITGPRQEMYDNPVEAFRRCATIASVLIGRTVIPQDCVKVLMALKQSRIAKNNMPEHMTDLAGYTDILNQVECAESNKERVKQ